MKIEMGGFYIFETITTTIAQVKSIYNDNGSTWVNYRTFDTQGKLINGNITRRFDRFKLWIKGRVKPRKRIP